MIQLHSHCLVFETADGEHIPCSVEDVSVEVIGEIIGKRRPVISLPPSLAYFCGWLIGRFMGDVTVTYDEVQGLIQDLLLHRFTARRPDTVH